MLHLYHEYYKLWYKFVLLTLLILLLFLFIYHLQKRLLLKFKSDGCKYKKNGGHFLFTFCLVFLMSYFQFNFNLIKAGLLHIQVIIKTLLLKLSMLARSFFLVLNWPTICQPCRRVCIRLWSMEKMLLGPDGVLDSVP